MEAARALMVAAVAVDMVFGADLDWVMSVELVAQEWILMALSVAVAAAAVVVAAISPMVTAAPVATMELAVAAVAESDPLQKAPEVMVPQESL